MTDQSKSYKISDETMAALLKNARTIAIVGLSAKAERASYQVARYLQEHGYRIIPVNPAYPEILGEKSYPSLGEVPEKIDIVDVFRRSEAVPESAQETLKLGDRPQGFWMQLGVVSPQAAEMLHDAGITVVQDECIKIVHNRLL